MAVVVQDNFDRANSTTVVGAPQVGPTPLVGVGTWGIVSNTLYTSASTAEAVITWESGISAVAVEVTLASAVVAASGPILRYVDASNYVACNTNGTLFVRRAAVNYLLMVPPAITMVVGDVVRFEAVGGYLWCYRNGVLISSVECRDFMTATRAGVRVSSSTNGRFDNLAISDAFNPDRPGVAYPVTGMAGVLNDMESFVYRGRDTKAADTGSA